MSLFHLLQSSSSSSLTSSNKIPSSSSPGPNMATSLSLAGDDETAANDYESIYSNRKRAVYCAML